MGFLSSAIGTVANAFGLGGDEVDTDAIQRRAYEREQKKLKREEENRKYESKFLVTKGAGARRDVELSFGNRDELDALSKDQQTVRKTGRFQDNRLVL